MPRRPGCTEAGAAQNRPKVREIGYWCPDDPCYCRPMSPPQSLMAWQHAKALAVACARAAAEFPPAERCSGSSEPSRTVSRPPPDTLASSYLATIFSALALVVKLVDTPS